MEKLNKRTIYDKNYTDLSIETVTEIDSSISKVTLLNEAVPSSNDTEIDVAKPAVKLLSQIHKDTYFLIMNSSPLLDYQAASNGTYNLFETKMNLLKQYKTVEKRIEEQKRKYLDTLDVEKVK